jgi:hypothetical protein
MLQAHAIGQAQIIRQLETIYEQTLCALSRDLPLNAAYSQDEAVTTPAGVAKRRLAAYWPGLTAVSLASVVHKPRR